MSALVSPGRSVALSPNHGPAAGGRDLLIARDRCLERGDARLADERHRHAVVRSVARIELVPNLLAARLLFRRHRPDVDRAAKRIERISKCAIQSRRAPHRASRYKSKGQKGLGPTFATHGLQLLPSRSVNWSPQTIW